MLISHRYSLSIFALLLAAIFFPIAAHAIADNTSSQKLFPALQDEGGKKAENLPPPAEQDAVSPATAISIEEEKLYRLINDYRKEKGLPEIPLSDSLTYVAQQHARDLAENHPMKGSCSILSWSNKGNWTPVCYIGRRSSALKMWNKPHELTRYPGYGYEIAHWSQNATAEEAFRGWKNKNGYNQLFLNQGVWENGNWQALGIGIYKGYVVAWFGQDKEDMASSSDVINPSSLTPQVALTSPPSLKMPVPTPNAAKLPAISPPMAFKPTIAMPFGTAPIVNTIETNDDGKASSPSQIPGTVGGGYRSGSRSSYGGGGAPGVDALPKPDYGAYMSELQHRIKQNWNPPSAYEDKHAVVLFRIGKDGHLLSISLQKSSGYSEADQAAMKAIRLSAPFRPLPLGHRSSDLPVQFTFDYNVIRERETASYRFRELEPNSKNLPMPNKPDSPSVAEKPNTVTKPSKIKTPNTLQKYLCSDDYDICNFKF